MLVKLCARATLADLAGHVLRPSPPGLSQSLAGRNVARSRQAGPLPDLKGRTDTEVHPPNVTSAERAFAICWSLP